MKKRKTNQLSSDLLCQLGHPHADRCDGLHKAVNPVHQADLDLYLNFYDELSKGEVRQHALLDLLKDKSEIVAYKCRMRDRSEDIFQRGVEGLLRTWLYTAKGSLGAYLSKNLLREALKNEGALVRPPRNRKGKTAPSPGTSQVPVVPLIMIDLDVETQSRLVDPRSRNLERAVTRGLVREKCMKQLLEKSKKSALHKLVVDTIKQCIASLLGEVGGDDYDILAKQLTIRGVSKKASKEFKTNVSRGKAARVLADVGPVFHDWLTG